MKFMMIAAAALCVAFAGCSKEEAKPADQAAKAAATVQKTANDAAKTPAPKAPEAPKPAEQKK